VIVSGDELTKKSVIMREVTTMLPERPLDMSTERTIRDKSVTEAENRLNDTNLFEPGSVKLTLQPEDPSNPGYRDVLLELKETNTGAVTFGVGAGSDSGLTGLVSVKQRNFDVADVPESFGELFSGRGFRGAGQQFEISVQPGTETQTYSISLSDPYLFDTDYSGSGTAYYFKEIFDEYNERKLGSKVGIGRRFGELWEGRLTLRAENVKISSIESDAPTDFFDVQGSSFITGLDAQLTRTTVDSRFHPTKGSRIVAEVERVGVLGGDYDFTRLTFEHQVFIPVYESFLGYRTVLSWKTQASYIPEGRSETPFFERLFLGGRSFRGFKFQTVSPKGYANDTGQLTNEGVGGTWLFFTGPELQQPIYQDIVSGVVFIDTGTVTNHPGFSEYRVSTGVGIRISVPALSPVPLAFDFAIPVLKQSGDQRRFFSFSLALPF